MREEENQNLEQRYQSLLLLVRRLLDERQQDVLQRLVNKLHAPDLAEILGELNQQHAIAVFRLLNTELASEVLAEIEDADLAGALLESVNQETVRGLLDNMSDDDLSNMLRDLDTDKTERFLAALLTEDAQAIREMIKQISGTAGARMTTAYMSLGERMTVSEALEQIRLQGEEAETINYLYIVDEAEHLKGVISLRELLMSPRSQVLEELMTLQPVYVTLDTAEEEAAQLIRRYDLQALPIVDKQLVIQGIITFDDALDILEEQGGADIYQIAGLSTAPDDKEDLLLRLPPLQAALKRLPWLIICIFGDMVTGGVIKGFEDVLSQVITLAVFIPVLMGSAGNIGTQSLSIAVRGIAMGNFSWRVYFSQVMREGQAGIILGLICGVGTGGFAALWQGDPRLGLAIALAMWCGLAVSSVIGMLVPLAVHFMKSDPALASGPVITTVADILTVFVYFVFASRLLGLAI